MNIRPASIDDCDRIGEITFAASMSWMVGALPAEAIDRPITVDAYPTQELMFEWRLDGEG